MSNKSSRSSRTWIGRDDRPDVRPNSRTVAGANGRRRPLGYVTCNSWPVVLSARRRAVSSPHCDPLPMSRPSVPDGRRSWRRTFPTIDAQRVGDATSILMEAVTGDDDEDPIDWVALDAAGHRMTAVLVDDDDRISTISATGPGHGRRLRWPHGQISGKIRGLRIRGAIAEALVTDFGTGSSPPSEEGRGGIVLIEGAYWPRALVLTVRNPDFWRHDPNLALDEPSFDPLDDDEDDEDDSE